MKSLLCALLALVPTLAAAEPSFSCQEKDAAQPYLVNFSNPMRTAEVRKQVAGGQRSLDGLDCLHNEIDPEARGPQPYLTCSENGDEKRGFAVVLYTGSNPIRGDLKLDGMAKANLVCGR